MAAKDSFRSLRTRPGPLAVALAIGAAGLGTALATGGSGDSTPRALPPAAADGESGPASHVSFLEKLIPPPPARRVSGPSAPRSVADLARRLPLERAVAQLFLFGFDGKDATAPIFQELGRLDLGGVVLDGRNYDSPQQLAALAGEVGVIAGQATHVPPWVMAEQDGGDYSQFANLPPARAPGDYADPGSAAAAMTEAIGALKALGVNGLLEPDLDVGAPDDALGTQALSPSPAKVADYARQVVAACRGQRVFCAPKHFPGIGSASTATDEGPAQVGLSLPALERRDMVPFDAAVKAGVPGMVVGEGLYEPDSFVTPAAMSKAIIGGLLRKRLRFGGLALTDDLADPGVSTFAQVPDAAVQALQAGADMVYISGDVSDQEAAYNAVLNAVRNGQIPEARVRQALLRILLTKKTYGLLR
jgi:beta-N-acetylhexosaminidase